MKPYLSVIIPAYNEELRISNTLELIHAYLALQPYSWEMLVVIDGGQDNTLAKVTEFSADKDQVSWIERRENRGKGYTVREGMLAAKGELRLFTDADNSTDINHLDLMIPLLEGGVDVVIGSRDAKDAPGAHQSVPQPVFKRMLGDLGNVIIQLLAVPGIWDTQCGFKAFNAAAAERIFSVARVNRWGFDIEALALARHYGYRIAVVPTRWIDDADTHVSLSDYITTLLDTWRIRWNLWTGAYDRPA